MTLFPLLNFPLVEPGADLAQTIAQCLADQGEALQSGDILVVAQKVVSKAEGRLVRLDQVTPGPKAQELAAVVNKDPRHVQVILDDSRAIIRARTGLLIVEQRNGWICANAGVDRSNVAQDDSRNHTRHNAEAGEWVVLLPEDADASAARLAARLAELTGVSPAVLINDSHGRAWRIGATGVCIGCAGLPPIWDQRGLPDLYGYELNVSEECIADELAAAGSLLMGQSNEGRPVVVIRGYEPPDAPPAPATAIQRPAHMDAFR